MIDFLTNNLEVLLTFIAGSGLTALLKMKSIKRQAEADAMKAVQEVYQETINDLRIDKEMMKKDNAELREMVSELQREVKRINEEIYRLKPYKCVTLNCELRKRDGGVTISDNSGSVNTGTVGGDNTAIR